MEASKRFQHLQRLKPNSGWSLRRLLTTTTLKQTFLALGGCRKVDLLCSGPDSVNLSVPRFRVKPPKSVCLRPQAFKASFPCFWRHLPCEARFKFKTIRRFSIQVGTSCRCPKKLCFSPCVGVRILEATKRVFNTSRVKALFCHRFKQKKPLF